MHKAHSNVNTAQCTQDLLCPCPQILTEISRATFLQTAPHKTLLMDTIFQYLSKTNMLLFTIHNAIQHISLTLLGPKGLNRSIYRFCPCNHISFNVNIPLGLSWLGLTGNNAWLYGSKVSGWILCQKVVIETFYLSTIFNHLHKWRVGTKTIPGFAFMSRLEIWHWKSVD